MDDFSGRWIYEYYTVTFLRRDIDRLRQLTTQLIFFLLLVALIRHLLSPVDSFLAGFLLLGFVRPSSEYIWKEIYVKVAINNGDDDKG